MFDIPSRDAQELALEQSERAYAATERIAALEHCGAGHTMRWDTEFYEAESYEGYLAPAMFWDGMEWAPDEYPDWWRWWSRHWRMYEHPALSVQG